MTIQTPNIKEIKSKIGSVPRWMGENAFFGFLILFFVALLISSFVFYQYVFSAKDVELKAEIAQTKFEKRTLERVVRTWQEKDTRFKTVGEESPRNIFAPSQSIIESIEESN